MAKTIGTTGVLISGEDIPGMDAAIRAVARINTAKRLSVEGTMRGHTGLLQEETADMRGTGVSGIIHRGGAILYMVRCTESTTPEGRKKDAEICKKHGIDELVVIDGDRSLRGASEPSALGVNTIGLPGATDLDIACTGYTIGLNTAVNMAIEVIDKVRGISTSHERRSIIEVTGRNAGCLVLWCDIANRVEDILFPERYGGDKQWLIDRIIQNRKYGKKYGVIINAEDTGHSTSMVRRIEVAAGIETRAIILDHMQRDRTPTCRDHVHVSIIGPKAAELLASGQNNRVMAYKGGEYADFDIQKALTTRRDIPEDQYSISEILTRQRLEEEKRQRGAGSIASLRRY